MTFLSGRLAKPCLFLSVSFLFLSACAVNAQDRSDMKDKAKGFCSQSFSVSDHPSFREERNAVVPSTGMLKVEPGGNGGIRVTGSDRSDIAVRACIHAWGDSDAEAKSVAQSIRLETSGGVIRAVGPDERSHWSVSLEIETPRNTDLDLNTVNGGISIRSVNGRIAFKTSNGGVSLSDLAGSVTGRTTNGGINLLLTGQAWQGSGVDVATTNGGVRISVPNGYSANLDAGTTNGGFKSDVAAVNVTEENLRGRSFGDRSRHINTVLNSGGATIKVSTTNGGVRIGTSNDANEN